MPLGFCFPYESIIRLVIILTIKSQRSSRFTKPVWDRLHSSYAVYSLNYI